MNTKRVITIILFILTLVIGGVVAYFGYKLATENQSPTPTNASCQTGCGPCSTDQSCNKCCGDWNDCTNDDSGNGHTWTNGWAQCNSSGGCVASMSTDKTTITLSSTCSGVTVDFYEKAYTGTSTLFYPNCVTTAGSSGVTHRTETGNSGQSFNSYKQGYCVQIDAKGVGVCRCEPPAVKKSCNVSCSSNSECASGTCYKANGSTSGKCRNSKCTSETDCTCNTTTASCGDGVKNQTSEECDVGVACADTTQVCNTSTCKCEDVPDQCGDTCEADTDCPTNTFCNGVTINDERYPDHMCVLSVCNDPSANCKATGCQVIPEELPHTAIINKQADWVIGGLIALLTGGLLLKFDVWAGTKKTIKSLVQRLQTGTFAYLTAPVSNEAKNELTDKKKKSFEKKIVKGK
jgi:hypothetical protein